MEHVLYPIYSYTLDYRSAVYAREVCELLNYPYAALPFNASIARNYTFWSHSDMNTYGSLYRDDFNPFQPSTNQISRSYYGCGNSQFRISGGLLSNTKYIVVVSTSDVNATGTWSVISEGPTSIQFVRLGKRELSSV
jgi:hypothetical protein